jgi:hypothetical protein
MHCLCSASFVISEARIGHHHNVFQQNKNKLGIFEDSLNLPTKQFVFLPVNDNENSEIAGGSHW